jgi:hypothetical protein
VEFASHRGVAHLKLKSSQPIAWEWKGKASSVGTHHSHTLHTLLFCFPSLRSLRNSNSGLNRLRITRYLSTCASLCCNCQKRPSSARPLDQPDRHTTHRTRARLLLCCSQTQPRDILVPPANLGTRAYHPLARIVRPVSEQPFRAIGCRASCVHA